MRRAGAAIAQDSATGGAPHREYVVRARVAPDSGTEPTPEQDLAQLIVNVCVLSYVVLVPLTALGVAWRTRRWILLALTTAAITAALGFLGIILLAEMI